MSSSQPEEKSFFSSLTSWFTPKPTTNAPTQDKDKTDEKLSSPRNPASTADNIAHPQTQELHALAEVPPVESTSSDSHEDSDADTELDGASDAHAQRRETTAEAHNVAHEVLERVDSLGTLDQQRSEEIDKAIEVAEAKTTQKIEKIKSEKNGGKEEEEHERKTWLAKARENIKYTFISKETEEAFGEILILFDKMFDDFPYNKVDLMFGLMMLDDYYKNAPILSSARVEDLEFIETVRYYMRFAYCCYGWKFVYGILNRKANKFLKSTMNKDANIQAIYDSTGVEPKDIIVSKFNSSVFDPGHYICLCHERKSIVVAFRGTFHVRDALTDLVASNTPFMQGSAHTGMLRTANSKFKILAPIILKCYEENPTYKVIVVGHSLGAGTASLFSLIFHEAHPEVPMHCYAYAPPGVVSPDLALASTTANLIDSIVVGDDVVPRLSFATLTHLKKIIVQILGSGNNTFQRAFQWMTGGMGDGLKNRVNGMLKIPEAAKIEPTPCPLSDISVFPPGRIILLVPHTISEEGECESESSSSDEEENKREREEEKENKREREEEKQERNVEEKKESVMEEQEMRRGRAESSEEVGREKSRSRSPSPSPPSPSVPSPLSSSPSVPSPLSSSPPEHPAIAPPALLPTSPLRRLSFSLSSKLSSPSSTSTSSASSVPPPLPPKPQKAKKPKKPKTVYLMEYSNSSLFNEIIISPTMFTSHMPNAYDKALESCLQTMKEIKNSSTKPNIVVTME